MKPLARLAHTIIIAAIGQKTPCVVSMEYDGISLNSYQDRIGIHQRLELYMGNYSNIDGVTGLRLLSEKDDHEEGSLFIRWDKISSIRITDNYNRFNIQLGSTNINFIKTILL